MALAQVPANPELYGSWSAPAALNPAETPQDDSMQAVHSILLHVGGGRVLCLGIEELVKYNKPFVVTTPDAANVTKVRLIRTGAATHSFDHNARMMELQFTTTETTVNVKAPQHGDLAPPGYYLLYICTGTNGQNPSEGKFVRLMPGSIGPGGGP